MVRLMRVFGRKWDDCDLVGRHYRRCYDADARLVVLRYAGDLFYRCWLCGHGFQHWLCDDRVWSKLPAPLTGKMICLGCFTAARKVSNLVKGAA